jgi:hypothetical protein
VTFADRTRTEHAQYGQKLTLAKLARIVNPLFLSFSGGGGEDRTLDLGVMNPTL